MAYFRQKRAFLIGFLGIGSATFLLASTSTALHFYPDDPRLGEHLSDASKTIVTTSQPATIRTDPMKSAAPLADLAPGTLCQMLSPRGNWSYIQTPTQQRAWIQSKDISPLIPNTKKTKTKKSPNYF